MYREPYSILKAPDAWLGETDRRSPAYMAWVQASLNGVMGAQLQVDGVIGPRTRAAVRAFQTRSGLPADGIVGPRTEAALVAAGAAKPPAATAPGPRPGPAPTRVLCGPPAGLREPERTVIALTSRFETGVPFGCVVSRTDGISMGMLQWNLLAGTLQNLLGTYERHTRGLRNYFGADMPRLERLIELRHTAAERRQAVTEALNENLAARWREPLLRLCADGQFCALLMADVVGYLRGAEAAARSLGLRSTRGLSMMFDIKVGDGLSSAKVAALARRIGQRETAAGRPLSEREKLVEIANQAADSLSKYREERRSRRLLIANGQGEYRRSQWNLDRDFPNLDQSWQ